MIGYRICIEVGSKLDTLKRVLFAWKCPTNEGGKNKHLKDKNQIENLGKEGVRKLQVSEPCN